MIRKVDDRLRLTSLRLRGWSSFGPDTPAIDLRDMNVLIGPNGAGKSNFVDALDILRVLSSTARDEAAGLFDGQDGAQGFFKGSPERVADIEVAFSGALALRYRVRFGAEERTPVFLEEELRSDEGEVFLQRTKEALSIGGVATDPTLYDPRQSVVSQLRDPGRSREVTLVGDTLRGVRLYRQWTFGPGGPLRMPQRVGVDRYISERLGNFNGVLKRVLASETVKEPFLTAMREFYPHAQDINVREQLGLLHLVVTENGYELPALSLSDGTLRWLFLLGVLLDPTPPPVIALEEPELGLHPDVIPGLARLLKEAAERTQLVIATHSGALVDEFSDEPESVVVCEKEQGSTTLRRLDRADLAEWLKDYRLGLLWARGHLGGNRW